MNTNLVLPLLSAIAVLTAILVVPVPAAIFGGALFVGALVALMARDYRLPRRARVTETVQAVNPLRLAA